jgi:hypothetical protein
MDINAAALKLKQIEIIENHIEHLQDEAAAGPGDTFGYSYSRDCHNKIDFYMREIDRIIKEINPPLIPNKPKEEK